MAKALKYDVNTKGDFFDVYPKLKSIFSNIDMSENITKVDSFARFIVYYYSAWSNIHTDVPEFTERREHALRKFNITSKVSDTDTFKKIEQTASYNYMIIENEAEFTYWISISTFFHKACESIRNTDKMGSNDLKETITSSDNLEKLLSKISIMEKKLFGNIQGYKEMMQEKSMKIGYAEKFAE